MKSVSKLATALPRIMSLICVFETPAPLVSSLMVIPELRIPLITASVSSALFLFTPCPKYRTSDSGRLFSWPVLKIFALRILKADEKLDYIFTEELNSFLITFFLNQCEQAPLPGQKGLKFSNRGMRRTAECTLKFSRATIENTRSTLTSIFQPG